jgi:hypothetical protein
VQTLQEIIISLSNNLIHSCVLKNLNEIFFYIITIKTTTEKIVLYCEYRASTTMPIFNDEAPKIKLILILWQIKNPFILFFKSKIKLILILWKIKIKFYLILVLTGLFSDRCSKIACTSMSFLCCEGK